jgi:hypothetical protein
LEYLLTGLKIPFLGHSLGDGVPFAHFNLAQQEVLLIAFGSPDNNLFINQISIVNLNLINFLHQPVSFSQDNNDLLIMLNVFKG